MLVDGVLREDELAEQTGFRLPEGPYETLAGFLMAQLGHIPVAGETLDDAGLGVHRGRGGPAPHRAGAGRRRRRSRPMTERSDHVLLLLGNALLRRPPSSR